MQDISGDEQRSYRGKYCPPEGSQVVHALQTRKSVQRGAREFYPRLP